MTDSIDGVPLPPAWEEQDPLLPYPGYFPETPEAWLLHRHRADKARLQDGGKAVRALFMGDSITAGWDKALWQEHFASHGAVNVAIGGDKTCQILWRIADGLLDNVMPDVVVLAVGVNNIWSMRYEGEHIARGVAKCLAAIQAKVPEAKVLLSAVLPCKESPEHEYRAIIREINANVQKLANGDTVRFVDAGSALTETDGTLPESISPDGVHLSAEGYVRIATMIVPAFDAIRLAT